jgi:hypothetical protein
LVDRVSRLHYDDRRPAVEHLGRRAVLYCVAFHGGVLGFAPASGPRPSYSSCFQPEL